MSPGSGENLRPRREVGLRPFPLDDEACDRGSENPASAQVEPASQAGVKARAIRVARTGHVDHFAGTNPRDPNSTLAGVHGTSAGSEGGHDDFRNLEKPFGGRDPCQPPCSDDFRLIPEKVGRPTEQLAEEPGRVYVVDFLRRI